MKKILILSMLLGLTACGEHAVYKTTELFCETEPDVYEQIDLSVYKDYVVLNVQNQTIKLDTKEVVSAEIPYNMAEYKSADNDMKLIVVSNTETKDTEISIKWANNDVSNPCTFGSDRSGWVHDEKINRIF